MTLELEAKNSPPSLMGAQSFPDLYVLRSQIIESTRDGQIWNGLSSTAKTILNISFPSFDGVIEMDDYRKLQFSLGVLLKIPPFEIRRITALETRTLADSLKNTTYVTPKKRPETVPLAGSVVNSSDGIVTARNGKQYNFTDIYHSYKTKVYNHLHRIHGDSERASNETQEVFTKFWTRLGLIEDVDFLVGPYLYKMASNLATDQLRRDNLIRFSSLTDLTGNEPKISGDLVVQYLTAPKNEDPLAEVIRKSDTDALHQALAYLPPKYRWGIYLIDFDRLSMLEAAEVLQTSRSAMKSLHFRAMLELKKLMSGQSGEYPQ